MKLVCLLGDPHFGASYSLGGIDGKTQINNRLLDYSNTFDYVTNYVLNNNIPHLIILGDNFEHSRPSPIELSLFAKKLHRLSEQGVMVHIIVGNHDLIRSNKATTLDVFKQLQLENIKIYSTISSITISNCDNNLNIIFLPYRSKHMLRLKTNDEAVEYIKNRIQFELEENCNNSYPTILAGHMTVKGSDVSHLLLSYDVSSEIILPRKLFKNIDMSFFGHIHNFSVLNKNPYVVNLGSMERNNFSDLDIEKKIVTVSLDNNKISDEYNIIPVRNLHEIQIDCTQIPTETTMKYIILALRRYHKENSIEDGIVRIKIFVSNSNFNEVDLSKIRKYLRAKKIFYCSAINIITLTMRQPRRASITEKSSDLDAFKEYLDLVVEDKDFQTQLLEKGEQIIISGGSK
jgi:DNA repair exonuclease SbcCD nuclease subunit